MSNPNPTTTFLRKWEFPAQDRSLTISESPLPDIVEITIDTADRSTTALLTKDQFTKLATLATHSIYSDCVHYQKDSEEVSEEVSEAEVSNEA